VNLVNTKVTERGAEELRRACPHLRVHFRADE
jgi:hypothetical protein